MEPSKKMCELRTRIRELKQVFRAVDYLTVEEAIEHQKKDILSLQTRYDEHQKKFWTIHRAKELRELASQISSAKSQLEKMEKTGPEIRRLQTELFNELFSNSFAQIDEELKFRCKALLATGASVKKQLKESREVAELLWTESSDNKPGQARKLMSRERELLAQFWCGFRSIKIEDGWQLTYVCERDERGCIRELHFFLVSDQWNICTNVFEHLIVLEATPSALLETIIFYNFINCDKTSVVIDFRDEIETFTTRKYCIAIEEVVDDFSKADADLKFWIKEKTSDIFTVHFVALQIDSSLTDEVYTYFEHSVDLPIGSRIGFIRMHSKEILRRRQETGWME